MKSDESPQSAPTTLSEKEIKSIRRIANSIARVNMTQAVGHLGVYDAEELFGIADRLERNRESPRTSSVDEGAVNRLETILTQIRHNLETAMHRIDTQDEGAGEFVRWSLEEVYRAFDLTKDFSESLPKASNEILDKVKAHAEKIAPCEQPCDSYGVCDNCLEVGAIMHGATMALRLASSESPTSEAPTKVEVMEPIEVYRYAFDEAESMKFQLQSPIYTFAQGAMWLYQRILDGTLVFQLTTESQRTDARKDEGK